MAAAENVPLREENVHPETLEEPKPIFLTNAYHVVTSFMVFYGWYFLFAILLFAYLIGTLLPVYKKYWKERNERSLAMDAKQNPERYARRQMAIDSARRKAQQEHDEKARVELEKRMMREEIRREEKLLRQEGKTPNVGFRLGNATEHVPATGVPKKRREANSKPDYNPLAGPGGSGGYRPSRRSCPGGGCG